MNPLIQSLTEGQLRTDIPAFRQGHTEMYTVRKISNGVGVERTFPVHTPRVEKIEVVRYGKVRRAKLYYLRALQGKAARIKEIRR